MLDAITCAALIVPPPVPNVTGQEFVIPTTTLFGVKVPDESVNPEIAQMNA